MTLAVLFDLDGTLTDSSQGIFRCFRYAFARWAETGGPDVALPGDEVLRDIVGPPLRQSFARYGGANADEAPEDSGSPEGSGPPPPPPAPGGSSPGGSSPTPPPPGPPLPPPSAATDPAARRSRRRGLAKP